MERTPRFGRGGCAFESCRGHRFLKKLNFVIIKSKMKKFFIIVFLTGLLFLPLISLAGEYKVQGRTVHYQGLIPCGKSAVGPGESIEVTYPCQFCHLLVMLDGIIDFLLFKIIPLIAVLMLVVGGIMFFFASGSPKVYETAKNLISSVIKGLVIIFSAWIIVNTVFMFIGLSEFGLSLTGPDKWNQINCEIRLLR